MFGWMSVGGRSVKNRGGGGGGGGWGLKFKFFGEKLHIPLVAPFRKSPPNASSSGFLEKSKNIEN